MAYVVSALGPSSFSIDSWAGGANWTSVHWGAAGAVRAGAAGGIGATAGLFTLASALARKAWATQHRSSPAH